MKLNSAPISTLNVEDSDDLVKIGVAAKTLKLSIDTIRRWEKSGKISSIRTPGGTRLFSKNQLIQLQKSINVLPSHEVMTITEASKQLGVSTKTLRRWDKAGKLTAQRRTDGNRVYRIEDLKMLNKKSQKVQKPPEVVSPVYPSIPDPISIPHSVITSSILPKAVPEEIPEAPRTLLRSFPDDNTGILEKTPDIGSTINFAPPSEKESPPLSILTLIKKTAAISAMTAFVIFTIFFGGWAVLPSQVKNHINLHAVALPILPKLALFNNVQAPKAVQDLRVLGESTQKLSGKLDINIPAIFNSDVSINGSIVLNNGDLTAQNISATKLTAENVIYSIKPAAGITITNGQTPTIANSGVLSLAGKTGALSLTAGTGISIDGLSITNSDTGTAQNIFKTISVGGTTFSASSNNDILTFAAGNGISVSTDTDNKKVTYTADLTASGWKTSGTYTILNTSTNNVGIGSTVPSSFKLQVAGSIGPETNGIYDLGSPSNQFGTVYASNLSVSGVSSSGQLLTTYKPTGSGVSQGSLYVNPSSVNSTNDTLAGFAVGGIAMFRVTANGTLLSGSDGSADLGSSSNRWNNLYVNTLTASGTNYSGQATFTYTPTSTAIGQGSIWINPTTAAATRPLLSISVGGTEKARISSDGYLGLAGANDPGSTYLINAGSNFNVSTGGAITSGTINSQTISSAANFTGTVGITTSLTSPIIYGGSSASSTLTLDGTSNGSPSNAYVVLNPSGQGNVGIGTSTPTNPLEVKSTTRPQVRLSYDTADYATFNVDGSGGLAISAADSVISLNPGVTNSVDFRMFTSSNNTSQAWRFGGSGNELRLESNTSSNFDFATTQEAFRISGCSSSTSSDCAVFVNQQSNGTGNVLFGGLSVGGGYLTSKPVLVLSNGGSTSSHTGNLISAFTDDTGGTTALGLNNTGTILTLGATNPTINASGANANNTLSLTSSKISLGNSGSNNQFLNLMPTFRTVAGITNVANGNFSVTGTVKSGTTQTTSVDFGANMISNGGFEKWGGGVPNNWSTSTFCSSSALSQDSSSSDVQDGTYNLDMNVNNTTCGVYVPSDTGIYQALPTLQSGRTYVVRFMAKLDQNADGEVAITDTASPPSMKAFTVVGPESVGSIHSYSFTYTPNSNQSGLVLRIMGKDGPSSFHFYVDSITISSGVETAMNISSGWDTDIKFGSSTPTLAIADGGTMSITDGTNTLFSIADGGTTGNATSTGNLAVNGGSITTTNATGNLFNTTATTLNIGGNATTALNIANTASTNYSAVNIVGSNATGTAGINIGTGGTGAKTVMIGSTASTSTSTLQSGSGGTSVTSTGALTLTGAAASTWSIGSNALTLTASNVSVDSSGNGTFAGNLAVNGTSLTSSSSSFSLLNATPTTINFGGNATTALNIANTASTNYSAVNIVGSNATGTAGINIGTGGTGAKTVSIGSTASTSSTAINSGSGAVNINASNNQTTNINTGSSTGAINIGNSSAGAIALSTAGAFGVTTTTSPQTYTSSVVSGNTTSSGFVFTDSSLTSGTAAYFTSSSITTGKLVDISNTSNTQTSGTLLNLSSTATSLTGTTVTGAGLLANLDWSPGSSTTATGDLFRINVGSNGTTTGSIFDIVNNSSSIFSVSQNALTSSLPTNFTSSGDVAVSYDINFTNPTLSTIKSIAPIAIQSGELFNSSNLTLQTYNQGTIILEAAASTGTGTQINANSLTTGNGLTITSSSITSGKLVNITPTFSGAAVTGYGTYISGTDSTTSANTDYQLYSTLALTGNAAKTGAGFYSTVSTSSTTADTLIATDLATSATGIIASGTRNNYGLRTQPASTSANTAGTDNTYGIYSAPSTTLAAGSTENVYGGYFLATGTVASGTVNSYGLYVANPSMNATGTSKKYGLYVEDVTANAAGSNYAAIFAGGNVGIGVTTPSGTLSVVSSNASGTTTSSSFNVTNSSLNSGTLAYLNSSSVTTGKLLDVASSGNTWTGNGTTNGLINFASTSTAGTGSASNILLNLSRSGANANTAVTSYGLYSNVTNTNATSGTNIGGYFSASGATTANYGLIVANGNVGIGTTSPTTTLSTVGSVSSAGSGIATISNNNTTDSANTVSLRINTGVASTGTSARFITFYDGVSSGDSGGAAAGHINLNNAAVNYATSGADYAEDMVLTEVAEPGDLISINSSGNHKSHSDEKLIGVVSDTAGFTGNSIDQAIANQIRATVGLVGQIKTKVSIENGSIQIGDYLTSSSTPGVAMKATKAGQMIGKALESYSANSVGKIAVFVNAGYADPNNFLASLSTDDSGNLIIPAIKTNKLTLPENLQSLGISSSQSPSSPNEFELTGKIATIEEAIQSNTDRIKTLEDKFASASAKIATVSAEVATPSAVASSDLKLTPPEILLATGSAKIADLTVATSANIGGKLTAYDLSVSNDFKALGTAELGSTTIAGDFTVDGTFSVTQGNTLNALPTLYLQSSPLAEQVNIFNGLVTIDKKGNLIAQTISASEFKATAGKSVGTGKIVSGSNSVVILTTLVKANSRILVTPTTLISTPIAVISKIEGTSFTVSISNVTTQDINFDWFIVNESP